VQEAVAWSDCKHLFAFCVDVLKFLRAALGPCLLAVARPAHLVPHDGMNVTP
jgi:hypothetical protein